MAADGSLRLTLQDVRDGRLNEPVDISLRHQVLSDERLIKGVNGAKIIVIDRLHRAPQGTYRIHVDPSSYLAVAQFVTIRPSGDTKLTLTFPVDPGKIRAVRFPLFADLPSGAQSLLTASSHVTSFEGTIGEGLYAAVDELRRAGFLNIMAKAKATRFRNGRSVLDYLLKVRELRGDRVFAVASRELIDETNQSVAEGLFRPVDGSLHHPPAGYIAGGSFKTEDHYGNLQLTFFVCDADCVVDVDIDDAAGLAHVFQVARNELTGRPTHPYDIREILIGYQGIDPGYTFEV